MDLKYFGLPEIVILEHNLKEAGKEITIGKFSKLLSFMLKSTTATYILNGEK